MNYCDVAGNSKGALGEIRGKCHFFTFRSEKILAFNCDIDIAGGRFDILFYFPNNWYKNIEEKVKKKSKLIFCHSQKCTRIAKMAIFV